MKLKTILLFQTKATFSKTHNNKNVKNQRPRENPKGSKRKAYKVRGNHIGYQQIDLSRNLTSWEGVGICIFPTMWHMYNISHKKEWNNSVCSNTDEPRDDHITWSKSARERQMSYDITPTWNLKKRYKWIYLQNRNKLTDIENKLMVTKEGRQGQG